MAQPRAKLKFDIEVKITRDQAREISRQIRGRVPEIAKNDFTNVLRGMPAIKRWMIFLNTIQFQSHFGIDNFDAQFLREKFEESLANIKIDVTHRSVWIRAINTVELKHATHHVWDNADNDEIHVNAWDIYENGIIGDSDTGGVIRGARIRPVEDDADEIFSRSGYSLMQRGGRFVFHRGAAPEISSVRHGITKHGTRITEAMVKYIGKSLDG